MIVIKKGLNIPLSGGPDLSIHEGHKITKVALLGQDYYNLKPTMHVKVGDKVKKGEGLFTCKKRSVTYTSPAGGEVIEINRGAKRVFESIVIKIDPQNEEEIQFKKTSKENLGQLTKTEVQERLLKSGLWSAIRERPYCKTAHPESEVSSVFIQAMESGPHAPSAALIISQNKDYFFSGLEVIKKLAPKTHLCYGEGEKSLFREAIPGVESHLFKGPHPSGLPGTHIHYIDPVHGLKKVWYLSYQDLMAIGGLFVTGKLDTERVVAITGPRISRPRLIKTRLGASIDELLQGELTADSNTRCISGSVLTGHKALGTKNFLGRYHHQVTAIEEKPKREFLGWMSLGFNKFSIKNIYLSTLQGSKTFDFTASQNGSPRAMVPIGMYEKVLPLKTNGTFLLRALLSNDTELAQNLGALELDQEDLALCTFVCPGKQDYGKLLLECLNKIEKEG